MKNSYLLAAVLILGSTTASAYREPDMVGTFRIPTTDATPSDITNANAKAEKKDEPVSLSTKEEPAAKQEEVGPVAKQPSQPQETTSTTLKEDAQQPAEQTITTEHLITKLKDLIGDDENIDGPMQHRWPS